MTDNDGLADLVRMLDTQDKTLASASKNSQAMRKTLNKLIIKVPTAAKPNIITAKEQAILDLLEDKTSDGTCMLTLWQMLEYVPGSATQNFVEYEALLADMAKRRLVTRETLRDGASYSVYKKLSVQDALVKFFRNHATEWYNLHEIKEYIEPVCWEGKTFFKNEADAQLAAVAAVLEQMEQEHKINRTSYKGMNFSPWEIGCK